MEKGIMEISDGWGWFPCSSDWLSTVLIRLVTELLKELDKTSNPLIQDTDSHMSSNNDLVEDTR